MNWPKYSLGYLCDTYSGVIQTGPFGSQLHQHDYIKDGTPVIMPKDIMGGSVNRKSVARIGKENVKRLSKHKVKFGDVVIPRRGEISKCTLITSREEGFICGTGCLKITPPATILNPVYFKYYLGNSNIIEWLNNNAVGATMKNLSGAILKRLPVVLPSIETQQKIAAILSAYDDLIENNLQRIKLLEEMAQITYEEWFVWMKFPGHEHTPIDSETGLPEGWKTDQIGKHFKTESGGTPSRTHPEYFDCGTIYWIKTQELRNNIILGSLEKISELGLKNSSAKVFPAKTVLLAMYGNTIGETGFLAIPAATNQACCAFLTDEYRAYYIHQYLIAYKQKILNYRMGAAQENISQQIIKKIKILIPTDSILKSYGVIISPIYKNIELLAKQNNLLKEARDILLPRLMTGMIDVDAIELPEALLERIEVEA